MSYLDLETVLENFFLLVFVLFVTFTAMGIAILRIFEKGRQSSAWNYDLRRSLASAGLNVTGNLWKARQWWWNLRGPRRLLWKLRYHISMPYRWLGALLGLVVFLYITNY